MNICLDLRYRVESGASAYVRHLTPALLAHKPRHRFVAVRYPRQQFDFLDGFDQVIDCPGDSAAVHMSWTLARLPALLRRAGVDVYHGLKMPGPYWSGIPTVTSVHSVMRDAEARFPSSLTEIAFVRLYGEPMLARSDRLVAVSKFVAESLVRDHGVSPGRIDVIPHGVAASFRPAPRDREALARLRLHRYILCVGNLLPVKNQVTVVRAFSRLARRYPGFDLVLAGSCQHRYADDVRREAETLGVSGRVRFLGFVNEGMLASLLSGAAALVIASLTEGFCVTLLEAMACGVPAVAAATGAMREFGPDAADFVDDPRDDREFAVRIERLLADPQASTRLSRRALARSSSYSWPAAARRHIAVYERCLAAKAPAF